MSKTDQCHRLRPVSARSVPLIAAAFVLAGALATHAAAPSGLQHKLSVGARVHGDMSEFEKLPFDKGDISYGLAYEAHEQAAFWQLALGYAPDVSRTLPGDDDTPLKVEYVLTPELNLMAKDESRPWQGGIGILASYLSGDEIDEWTPVYWQLLFGLRLPVASLDLSLSAYYLFEDWGKLGSFKGDEMEFGGWLSFTF